MTVALGTVNLEAKLQEGLPSLPEGRVYVMWTILQPDAPFTKDRKNAVLTHTFTGQGDQTESVTLPAAYRDRRWVEAIAVTIEDAEAPQRHASSSIFMETL